MSDTPNQSAPPGPDIAVLSLSSTVVDAELTRSLEEMIFHTTADALAQANLSRDELDGVVLSGFDEIDGRVISCMTSAGPAAGVDRDTTMIASSGDHALAYGYLRLKSGQGKNVLVVGWAKPSESVSPHRAEVVSSEPFILRQFGMTNTIAAALQASKWTDRKTSSSPTVAWPLGEADLAAKADSVHAAVLAIDGSFPEGSECAWIVEAGWATDSYELGSRDIGKLTALQSAVDQFKTRSPEARPEAWDIIEIAADSEPAVAKTAEVLQLSPNARVNESGNLREQGSSPHVAGLSRMMAAARGVSGTSPVGRKGPKPMISAGIGMHGFAGQGASIMVFSDSKGGKA